MRLALLLIPLLAALAFAQEPAPPPVRIESVRTAVAAGQVRIDIETSAPLPAPGVVVPYPDMLILDLPGATQEGMGRRIQVNKAGVKDVRVWLHQQEPPILRISVSMDRDKAYALSVEGNRLTLRIGPGLQTAGRSAGSRPAQRSSAVIPAARASRGVAGTVGAIFTRDPKQPAPVGQSSSHSAGGNDPAPLPPIHISESTLRGLAAAGRQSGADGISPNEGADPLSSQQAPPSATEPEAPSLQDSSLAAASSGVVPEAPEPSAAGTSIPLVPATVISALVEPAAVVPSPGPAPAPIPPVPADPLAGAAPTMYVPAPAAAITPLPPSGEAPPAPEAPANPPAAASPTPLAAMPPPVPNAAIRTVFRIKFVQQDTAYIDGGRIVGLAEGMKLLVSSPDENGELPKGVSAQVPAAELTVFGIAETSAAAQILSPQREIVPGDLAYFSDADLRTLVEKHSLSSTRKYPVVISFTEEADALDAEARLEDVPRPPLPSVNRMQGRLGFDYMATQNLGAGQSSGKDVGIVVRADFTRMAGTYWNFRGYWRGRIDYVSSSTQPTLQELINRTYHLALTYDNPAGHWVAGFGRLLLPWAASLETLDGGYLGRRLPRGLIAGVFAGTAPDPSSWNYDPDRQMGGAFVNATGGSFDGLRYSITTGAGATLLNWKTDRPMVFFENNLSYKRTVSIYHSLQADSPAGNAATTAPGPGIGRSFFTVRWSPVARLELDFNHTFFRNVPTFDPRLVGTGLLDKYLFQGLSGGARLAIAKHISVYTQLGRSNRTGDDSPALNSLYGLTFGRLPWLDLRADLHYSRFHSSFGSGSYRSLNLTRHFRHNLRLELSGGTQIVSSALAGNQTAKFVTTTMDSNLGAALFVQGGFTLYRGQQQSYNQIAFMTGWRFDSKWRR